MKCTICKYCLENKLFINPANGKVDDAVPYSICTHCDFGLCKGCIQTMFGEDCFSAMLDLGGTRNIMASCFVCNVKFCKYGIFGDVDQIFTTHYYGPEGASPLCYTCLCVHPEDMEYMLCEIENCVQNDILFCGTECKDKHSPKCKECKERTHDSFGGLCKECYEAINE